MTQITAMSPVVPAVAIVLSVLCLWRSLVLRRRHRLLADLPTSKVQGVFIGLVELKGTAETHAPFTSVFARVPCVYYHYEILEDWERTVTETTTDSEGRKQTTTTTESGSDCVGLGGETQDFYLRDETGVVLVRPEGAKLEATVVFDRTVTPADQLYYEKGPANAVNGSRHRRRFVERAIALHESVYIVGAASERPDIVAPMLAESPDAPLFLISTQAEEKVQAKQGAGSWVWWSIGLLLAMLSAGLVWQPAFAGAGIYVGLWALCWTWMAFNSLVSLRNRVRQGWSLIDVQLKRRHDLIPSLVAIVGGLQEHEQTTQAAVTALRTQLSATPPGMAGPDFTGVTSELRAVTEKYPALAAESEFVRLHRALTETEQRIALAWTYYNEIATQFATRLEQVPDRWVAALGGMRPEPLLKAETFERAAVTMELANAR